MTISQSQRRAVTKPRRIERNVRRKVSRATPQRRYVCIVRR